jgi:hypothetical protein
MGINLNGTTIAKSGSDLIIGRSNTALTFDSSGRLIRGSIHPMFYAANANDWTSNITATGWNTYEFPNTELNNNSCFSTSTYRFTAPIQGIYLFTLNTYHDDPAEVPYYHPEFVVNGALAGRTPASTGIYRIRHADKTSGYASDGNISQLYYLSESDYVYTVFYLPSGTIRYYRYASHFAGFLVT